MDRQAFKQRMQNLKSYRENNPGKGYWDWKVAAYADGGEVKDDRTDHSIAKPIIPENIERIVNGKPWSQLSAQEQFMNRSGYSNGRPLEQGLELVHPEFDILSSVRGISSTVKGLMDTVIGRKLSIDYAYRRTTANELKDIIDTNSFRSIPDNVNLPTKTVTTASGKTFTFGKKKGNSHGVKAFSAGEPWKATTASGDEANEIIIGIPGDNAKWMTGFHGNYEGPFNFKDINKGTGIAVPFNEQGIADISTKGLKVFGKPSKYFSDRYLAYADGGQTGDPDEERFYQATGRSRSGRPLEEGLKPVFSLEDAANMTPIGDAISAKDAYDAVKNRDWLGAGLAAVTMIPFVPTTVRNFRKKYKGITTKREIPTVNKKAIDNAIDEAKNYRDGRIKLYQQAIEDRNASYERLIENEDALRRAVNFDKKYGTNYVKTYTEQLQNYAKSKNSPDLMQIGIKPMGANGSFDPNIPDYVFINSDYVKNGKLQPGLISHEKSHYDNQKAGALSLPIFDNRFIDTKKTKTMYPKTYDWIQRYLHNFEETKSHMNEFRTNMINKNLLKPDSRVGLKQIKDLIFNSDNDNIKKLFNTYKSKRQFVKDFNSVPITSIGDNKTLV